jgi:hypothetical protein
MSYFAGNSNGCYDPAACVDSGVCTDGWCVSDTVPRGLCRTFDLECRMCGQPVTAAIGPPTAADALAVLKSAVGTFECLPCLCDVDSSAAITVADALLVLKRAVGAAAALECPHF